ncbi:MAG: cysteine hydrolase [Methanomicrobiaceae archaeon]|nr:cysteine hydrolase [Methanomicrobiaceae archaeon]
MAEKIRDISRRKEQEFHPESSALLIVDMQNYFTDPKYHAYIPSSAAIIPRIKLLTEVFARKKRPVISTIHINTPEDAGMMEEWWGELLTETGSRSDLNEELNLCFSTRIRKTQYDAFFDTELDSILRKNNISDLVVTGVITHLCCETTARSAFVHGYRVFFPADGTATYNEEFHEASLASLAHGFASISVTGEIRRIMENYEG